MLKTVKGIFSLGLRAARLTKRQAEKHLRPFVSRRLISKSDAKNLVGAMLREARSEGSRVKNFVKQEVKRELSKARSAVSRRRSKSAKKKRLWKQTMYFGPL